MKKIGELLRDARTEKNITLNDISQKTKIQEKYLHALEKGDHTIFSGEIYIKGALRNYAQAVGLNVDEILSLYNQFIEQQPSERKEQQPTKKEQSFLFVYRERRPFPGVVIAWLAILVFVIAGSIWYLHGQGNKRHQNTPYSEGCFLENDEKQTKNDLPESVTPIEEPAVKKELTMLTESRDEVTYALSGVEQTKITLDFPDRCWVRILQDGAWVEEKIFNAGERKNLGDARETLLYFGNPPAARVTVNGLEIDNLIRFTSPVKIIIKKE